MLRKTISKFLVLFLSFFIFFSITLELAEAGLFGKTVKFIAVKNYDL